MKHFFLYIFGSISSLQFYAQLQKISLIRVVCYYLLLLFITSSFFTAVSAYRLYPSIQNTIASLKREVIIRFPEDLTISWDGSVLLSSKPIVVSGYPKDLTNNFPTDILPENFFALSATPAAFLSVSATHLTFSSKDTVLSSLPLSEILIQPTVLTKDSISDALTSESAISTTALFTTVVIAGVVFLVALTVTKLASLLFEILFFYFVQRVLWGTYSLLEIAKLLLAVSIPAEIITTITSSALPHTTVPIFSITLWVYLTIILFSGVFRRS